MEIDADRPAFDAAVVGGGPAGLTAALALARSGAHTALIARRIPYGDNRTTALLHASVRMLEELGVWTACSGQAAPMRALRLIDDSSRLVRAPEVRFDCDEIGLVAFGYNIENRSLVDALACAVDACPDIDWIDDEVIAVAPWPGHVEIRRGRGAPLQARLAVGADGRNSLCRSAAGIGTRRRDLDQSALTLNVTHTRPHGNASTEFHTADGPCVFVPLPGNRSSVVWMMRPEDAELRASLDDATLARTVEDRAHAHLGQIRIGGQRSVFPLVFEQAAVLASQRIALVGEAAHVLPPFGAQGLNLGLRDAAEIAAIAGDALLLGNDPGDDAALDDYCRRRRIDVFSRTLAVDVANRSLLSDLLPVQVLRSLGMQAMQFGPLRRFVMRQAIAPGFSGADG